MSRSRIIIDTAWSFLLLPVLLARMHSGVVRREERYLEAKFCGTYLEYKARLRRCYNHQRAMIHLALR